MSQSWDSQSLQALGVTPSHAETYASEIQAILKEPDPERAWQQLVEKVLAPSLPFELHLALYRELSSRRTSQEGPLPVWFPSEADHATANVTKLAAEVGQATFSEVHQWSVENRMAFWEKAITTLGIAFSQQPTSIGETTANPGQPRWLPGAKLNIADSCFQADPEKTAILWQSGDGAPFEKISYGALRRRSGQVALGLQQQGFEKGDAIAIDMVMNPESVAIYLGILRAGCTVISIADSFSPAEIATRLRIGKAKGIFTMDVISRGRKTLPMYEKVTAADAPRAIVIPCGSDLSLALREGDLSWREFLPEESLEESVQCASSDLVNILFSSGTTGDPKAIGWTHVTPIKAGMDGHYHHDIHPDEIVAWPTNLGWMMGPWLIFASLLNRATIALYGNAPTGADFCRFVAQADVNMLGVVPSLVKAWRNADAIAGLDWTKIRAFSSTGECSNAEDMHYLMAQAGYSPVLEYCGGTEIGGGFVTGTMVQPAVPAAFSTPALGVDFVILDEAHGYSDVGELFLVPPSIGLSSTLLNRDHEKVYYEGVPNLAEVPVLRRHGDQFQKLPGGYYRAEGRADDTMNLGGIKVGSAEIERVLKGIPQVNETAAVAVPPLGGGPAQLVIFASLLEDVDLTQLHKEMQRLIRSQLNPLFKIHDLQRMDVLPRTASGKVMRRVLRSHYAASP